MAFQTSTLYLLLSIALGFVFIAKVVRRRVSRLPPGPWPIPVIGNLHQVGTKPHQSLAKLAQTHGPIMSLKFGQMTTIIISSAQAAKQVLQKQDHLFANRAVPDCLNACNHAEATVIWLPLSPKWRELRKIMNSHMFSGQRLDATAEVRQQKVGELLAEVQASCELGKGILIGEAAFKTSLNLLSSTIFSMNLDSDVARDFKESFRQVLELGGMANMVDYFPWLKRFDPQGIRARMEIPLGKMLAFLETVIGERLAERAKQGSYENKDVLDTLLDISAESEEINGHVIRNLLVGLFIAGTDTTSSSVEWALSEMLKNQQIMYKAKAELEQVTGKGKPIQDDDIVRLPYLQAIVKETLRVHPPAPLLLPRKMLEDVELWDFRIPKGAKVVINEWAISRDPSTWDSPECFNPDRFLGVEVDMRGGNFELIPFGGGRRICPGLPLALKMVHLELGSLINCYNWKLEGDTKPEEMDMDDKFGITLQKTQPLCAVPLAI